MGLFDKKFCDICGEKVNMLTQKKLSDGQLCSDCKHKLGSFTSGWKQRTVQDVKNHLEQREQNKQKYQQFNCTATAGGRYSSLQVDFNHRWFIFAIDNRDFKSGNPQVFEFSQLQDFWIEPEYRTLDDSIHAPGIALLAKAAMELGEVTVVAPAHQCSAMSQKITIRGDMRVDQVADFPVPVKAAYMVDGTPADCVKIAMQYLLEEKPDYVFSGINDGYNAGFDIAYSGTLGAAFEAVMNGVPAMAFSSTMNAPLHIAEKYLVSIMRELMEAGQGRGEVWNVNFPAVAPEKLKGILRERTVAPLQFYSEDYRKTILPDGAVALTGQGSPLTEGDAVPAGTDVEAVLKGYISIGKVKCAVM